MEQGDSPGTPSGGTHNREGRDFNEGKGRQITNAFKARAARYAKPDYRWVIKEKMQPMSNGLVTTTRMPTQSVRKSRLQSTSTVKLKDLEVRRMRGQNAQILSGGALEQESAELWDRTGVEEKS